MKTLFFALVAALGLLVTTARAQDDTVFIQIEARTSLASAQQSVRNFTGVVDDINGFSLGGGWYGVALGPYGRAEAERLLNELRRAGRIPADSYIAFPSSYGQQFWPVGAQVISPGGLTAPVQAPTVTAEQAPEAPVDAAPEETVAEPVQVEEPDETPRQARASERQLTRDERKELQVALKWAGFYTAAIDGAFGRGTRNSMAAWQGENGFETTGVLTTRQRAVLMQQYNSVLDGMGMAAYADPRVGIAMQLPLGVVSFDRYEAPFALLTPKGDLQARVLLISQQGDRGTMSGLYEIMQTLEIVPLEGERERRRDGFLLTGANNRIVSHTEVTLRDGEIKGFSLIWPAGDEERRTRVLGLMQKSFERIEGVLDPAAITDDGQSVDLVSGLKIRTPKVTASGFFVDNAGTVLTSAAGIQGCSRVTLDGTFEASVTSVDDALGLALLAPKDPIAPRRVVQFQADTPRLQSEVAVAGYSFGGVLRAPSLTYGSLQDLKGLGGEEGLKRLALSALPGDVGGPVFDAGGTVLGMLLPREKAGSRRLPDDVSFAANNDAILGFLRSAGVQVIARGAAGVIDPEDLTALATDTTVLVSCWE